MEGSLGDPLVVAPRLTFAWGYSERRLLRARARGDGTGRKRGANWPSVCLRAGSHGNGLSCVPHANTGVHSKMSDVSVQATVSFNITFTPSRPRGCGRTAFGNRVRSFAALQLFR